MPKNAAKKLQSQSHFALPPIFTIKKNRSFYQKILKMYALMLK
jgi:hypothetical protein